LEFGCGGPHLAALQTMPEINRPVCDVVHPVSSFAGATSCGRNALRHFVGQRDCSCHSLPLSYTQMDDRSSTKEAGWILRCLLHLKAQIWWFAPTLLALITYVRQLCEMRLGRDHGVRRRAAECERWRLVVLLLHAQFRAWWTDANLCTRQEIQL